MNAIYENFKTNIQEPFMSHEIVSKMEKQQHKSVPDETINKIQKNRNST